MSTQLPPRVGDDWYREQARKRFQDEGYFEIDDSAPISQAEGNPDRGAYVQAWVWIEDPMPEDNTLRGDSGGV